MLTVADVLALPALGAGAPRVRAGEGALDVPVRWVHVTEQVDVAGLLGGGELLLTTGMGWHDAGFDPGGFIGSLVEAGVVALVVELTEHLHDLPPGLVRAARAAALPLVELHRVVRFVEVTEQVHGRLLHDQYDRLRFADRVHTTFASLALVATPVQEVLDRAAALLGGPVVLEDLAHRVVAHVPHPVGTADLLTDWSRRSRRAGEAQGWLVVPAGAPGDHWGRLIAPGPVSAPEGRLVLERAAEVLTVRRLVTGAHDGDDLALRAHDDLVRDLLRARAVDEPALRQRLRALGLSGRGGFAAAAVVGADRVEVSAALGGVRGAGLTGTIDDADGPVVGVLLAGGAAVVEDVLERLARALPPAATLGAAAPAAELHATGEGFAEARHVARVAAASPHRAPGRVQRTADLGVRGLLWRLRGDARLAGFAEEQLAPLLTGPDGGRADLELLGHLVGSGGSMTRLASLLHLSRPAAYGRVERLARRLGRDPGDPETRLALHLALLVREQGPERAGAAGA